MKYLYTKETVTGTIKTSTFMGKYNGKKKQRKKVSKDGFQTAYMKVLYNLRNAVSLEYSKVIQKKKRGIILGYD